MEEEHARRRSYKQILIGLLVGVSLVFVSIFFTSFGGTSDVFPIQEDNRRAECASDARGAYEFYKSENDKGELRFGNSITDPIFGYSDLFGTCVFAVRIYTSFAPGTNWSKRVIIDAYTNEVLLGYFEEHTERDVTLDPNYEKAKTNYEKVISEF